jgi:hypothetical protein
MQTSNCHRSREPLWKYQDMECEAAVLASEKWRGYPGFIKVVTWGGLLSPAFGTPQGLKHIS